MKRINELTKHEKILLLKSIAQGEVSKEEITPKTLFGIKHGEWFLGLMWMADNPDMHIVCIGEAAKDREEMIRWYMNNNND